MKPINFLKFSQLLACLLLLIFSACTETEDPAPSNPEPLPPTNGIPGSGGNGNGNGGGNGPIGGGNDKPSTAVVGMISSSVGDYEFSTFGGAEVENQPNAYGAYPIVYYYGDDDAAKDTDGDDSIEGVITGIAFNAEEAGVIEPGEYTYSIGSEQSGEFSYVMLFDHAKIYVVADAQIQVATTNSNDFYGVVFEGTAVEVEEINGELEVISEPFDMEGQFLVPASSTNAARQDRQYRPKLPTVASAFSISSY